MFVKIGDMNEWLYSSKKKEIGKQSLTLFPSSTSADSLCLIELLVRINNVSVHLHYKAILQNISRVEYTKMGSCEHLLFLESGSQLIILIVPRHQFHLLLEMMIA